ncbi:MAG TPA: DUF3576 domain-containing protein [Acetobacteraceae bacterium]|nr:DUF3576 domain-containing protein [Acetobacteraceae bacterium]
MRTRILALGSAIGLIGLLAGCGSDPVTADHINGHKGWDPGTGSVLPSGTTLFGSNNKGSDQPGIGVNAYLWRAALDTLSFMPLASADPFGGVIITDWYQPPSTPDERFKATAYILGRQLRADGIRISVFRQTLTNGEWQEAPVTAATAAEIENKVLARARELRTMTASQ